MQITPKNSTTYGKFIYFTALLLALIAAIFSMKLMYENFISAKNNFAAFGGKTLDEKYTMIDGMFYKFMVFCKSNIPQGSPVLFYNSWSYCVARYGADPYFQFEYERQKSKFYLYPIKSNFLFYLDETLDPEQGQIRYHDEEAQVKDAAFIIMDHPDREFSGFTVKYRYDADHYILTRGEKDNYERFYYR